MCVPESVDAVDETRYVLPVVNVGRFGRKNLRAILRHVTSRQVNSRNCDVTDTYLRHADGLERQQEVVDVIGVSKVKASRLEQRRLNYELPNLL